MKTTHYQELKKLVGSWRPKQEDEDWMMRQIVLMKQKTKAGFYLWNGNFGQIAMNLNNKTAMPTLLELKENTLWRTCFLLQKMGWIILQPDRLVINGGQDTFFHRPPGSYAKNIGEGTPMSEEETNTAIKIAAAAGAHKIMEE